MLHRSLGVVKRIVFASILLFFVVGGSSGGRDYRDEWIAKDGTLDGLARVLNDPANREMFNNWQGSMNDTQHFLQALEPWILSSPTAKLVFPKPRYVNGNGVHCSDPMYENVLTGHRQAARETLIIDFVPFGYDVDKLLLRFAETWDSVDVFVVYEMPYTLLGIPKPLYFPRIREQARFKRFETKIMFLVGGDQDSPEREWSLERVAGITRYETDKWVKEKKKDTAARLVGKSRYGAGKAVGNKGSEYLPKTLYLMMYAFDSDIVRLFKLFPSSMDGIDVTSGRPYDGYERGFDDPHFKTSVALKGKIVEAMNGHGVQVLGIQNDGDEIVRGHILAHLKHCEVKKEVLSIYAPCYSYKNNFYWLQATHDMKHFGSGIKARSERYKTFGLIMANAWLRGKVGHRNNELNAYLWHAGPFLWPLSEMLNGNSGNGSVLRRNYTNNLYNSYHMGYGAAFHLSAVNDPAEVWMKACGTVENVDVCWRSISDDIVRAGATGSITPQMIYDATIKPWCSPDNPVTHVDELHKMSREAVMDAIPSVVRDNPAYFPFIYPRPGLRSTGLFEKCASKNWRDEC